MGNDLNNVSMPLFTKPSDAPAGHVPISSLWPSKGNARDRERVRRGVFEGAVKASRLQATTSGKRELYVHAEQARKWLAGWDARGHKSPRVVRFCAPAAQAEPEGIERSVSAIVRLLERLVVAAEAIAAREEQDEHQEEAILPG